ncbi:hypothetical protein [Winogradskyella bathintestinalis]|uniref:hypothetical protein n=1 Tax=Winogradskyella bathintestinalis TaxID=3035208 RepID=UPI0025B38CA8|nr:hypothetical protein [Winogradskyella bathintestinalis]
MGEFLKQNYFLLTYSVEFLAAVIGLFSLKKYSHTAAKFLIYFLVYALIIDLLHGYPQYLRNINNYNLIEGTLFEKNYWLSNIFWFGGLVCFLFFINYKIINNTQLKTALKYSFIVYLLLFVLYAIFNFSLLFLTLNSFVAILSLWMVFVCSSVFYVQFLQSDLILAFHKSLYFFINSCFLLWNIIMIPLVFYEIYFSTADWNFVILKWQIYLTVNIIFYLTLSLALIFCKPEIK